MQAQPAGAEAVAIDAQRLTSAVADIFRAVGIAAEDARVRAAAPAGESAVDTPDATAIDLEMAPAQ